MPRRGYPSGGGPGAQWPSPVCAHWPHLGRVGHTTGGAVVRRRRRIPAVSGCLQRLWA
jgi:hypothetical protein